LVVKFFSGPRPSRRRASVAGAIRVNPRNPRIISGPGITVL
jgi:hypothetical protein